MENTINVKINDVLNDSGRTMYKVDIVCDYCDYENKIIRISWFVRRRFRDFLQLHADVSKLGIGVDVDLSTVLLKKKLLNNQNHQLISKRKINLETYLVSIVKFLQHSMPSVLVKFLELDVYHFDFILNSLGESCQNKIVSVDENFKERLTVSSDATTEEAISEDWIEWSPVQLFSFISRLKSHIPVDSHSLRSIERDLNKNFTDVAEFVNRLKRLRVVGSSGQFKSSNIIPNNLNISFTKCFRILTHLSLVDVNLNLVHSIRRYLSNQLIYLRINQCGLYEVDQVLKTSQAHESCWPQLETLDLAENEIRSFPENLQTVTPILRFLSLASNQLCFQKSKIESEGRLPVILNNLEGLDLSKNRLKFPSSFVTSSFTFNTPNLRRLNLSANKLKSLSIIDSFQCSTTADNSPPQLHSLDISDNYIDNLNEIVERVRKFKLLRCLDLNKNPICLQIDYRINLLSSIIVDTADDDVPEKTCDVLSEFKVDGRYSSKDELNQIEALITLKKLSEVNIHSASSTA